MSYSPVTPKRPYGYDSPISNVSYEHNSYSNGYSCLPSRSNTSIPHLTSSNPLSKADSSHSFPCLYSDTRKPFLSSQASASGGYNYQPSLLATSQQLSATSYGPLEDANGNTRYASYSSKETVFTAKPQFHLTSNHYIEISNKCDNIVEILSTFNRSDSDNINQLVDSARALYEVFLEAEQKVSSKHSSPSFKNTEKPKKRIKNNQTKLYCHSCNCTDTPEWRKGPLGPRTLCNACGLIWAKLSKKKAKEAQLAIKHRKAETKSNESHSISTASTPDTFNNDNSYIGEVRLKAAETFESKGGKIDDKKLTLSFLLS